VPAEPAHGAVGFVVDAVRAACGGGVEAAPLPGEDPLVGGAKRRLADRGAVGEQGERGEMEALPLPGERRELQGSW